MQMNTMHCFRVRNHGICHASLVFSVYTQSFTQFFSKAFLKSMNVITVDKFFSLTPSSSLLKAMICPTIERPWRKPFCQVISIGVRTGFIQWRAQANASAVLAIRTARNCSSISPKTLPLHNLETKKKSTGLKKRR